MRAYTSIRTQTHGVTGHTTPRHMPRTDTHPNLDLASAATGPGRPRVRRLPYRSGCHTAAIFTPPSPPRRFELRSIKPQAPWRWRQHAPMRHGGCGLRRRFEPVPAGTSGMQTGRAGLGRGFEIGVREGGISLAWLRGCCRARHVRGCGGGWVWVVGPAAGGRRCGIGRRRW